MRQIIIIASKLISRNLPARPEDIIWFWNKTHAFRQELMHREWGTYNMTCNDTFVSCWGCKRKQKYYASTKVAATFPNYFKKFPLCQIHKFSLLHKVWNNLWLWSKKDSTQFLGQLNETVCKRCPDEKQLSSSKQIWWLTLTLKWGHWWNSLTLCFTFYWFLLLSCSRDPAVTSFKQKKPMIRIHKQSTGAHPFRWLISKNTTIVFFIFREKPQSKPETYLYISSAWEEWISFRPDQACLDFLENQRAKDNPYRVLFSTLPSLIAPSRWDTEIHDFSDASDITLMFNQFLKQQNRI